MGRKGLVVFSDDDASVGEEGSIALAPPPEAAAAAAVAGGDAMQTEDPLWSSPEPEIGKKRGPGNRVVVVDDDGEGGNDQGNDGAVAPRAKKVARERKSKIAKRQETQDSDDGSGGYDSEEEYADLDDVDYHTMAQQVLQQCESFSSSLRTALSKWEAGALERDKTTAGVAGAAGGGSAARSNCVQLIKIASSDAGEVLAAEDIAKVCPNLVLKEYQLVGVNWIKLLHSNPPVNGVLADDVSPDSFLPLSLSLPSRPLL